MAQRPKSSVSTNIVTNSFTEEGVKSSAEHYDGTVKRASNHQEQDGKRCSAYRPQRCARQV
jgi:hypothetical protein